MFNRTFSFEGRIRRTEFGVSLVIYVICSTFLNLILEESHGEMDILTLAYIPLIWFLWSQGAKRCHDLGNSGWWQIIPFYVFWMLFQDGQPYSNNYGDSPKGLNQLSNNFSEQLSSDLIKSEEAKAPPTEEENFSIGTTLLEIQNASYGNIQDIVRQFRNVERVRQLSYEYLITIGTVTIGHIGSSQQLLEEFLSMVPDVEVLKITNGHITIKLI